MRVFLLYRAPVAAGVVKSHLQAAMCAEKANARAAGRCANIFASCR